MRNIKNTTLALVGCICGIIYIKYTFYVPFALGFITMLSFPKISGNYKVILYFAYYLMISASYIALYGVVLLSILCIYKKRIHSIKFHKIYRVCIYIFWISIIIIMILMSYIFYFSRFIDFGVNAEIHRISISTQLDKIEIENNCGATCKFKYFECIAPKGQIIKTKNHLKKYCSLKD